MQAACQFCLICVMTMMFFLDEDSKAVMSAQ